MAFQGFSPQLQTAADLVAKLDRDLARMSAEPRDADAAFNFFVTADHVEEWRAHAEGSEFGGHPKGHKEARGVQEREGYFDPSYFDPGYFDTVGGIDIDHIGFDGRPAGSIDAVELATLVVAYLRAHVG